MLLDIISRPTTTEDLVRRLQNPETNANERVVLQTLASKMVGIFKDDKSYVHIREAAAVAPFEDWSGYKDLLWTFMDAVIDGTADGSILRPELCDQFVRVLRLCDSIDDGVSKPGQRPVDLQLELVMVSLQRRLEVSIGGAGLQAQYQIVDTLGRVLDAMNDAKTAGISRERYRESLLKSLDELGDSNEIRLAQAASYAYEALRGIPDDEGPYKALLRHGMGFVQAGAKIAGAVPTMDPSKLVDGLIALADVPDLVSSMVDVVEQISEAVKAIRGVAQDVKLQRRPKKWYIALRFADILIQAREFPKVVEFIRDVPCRLDFDFLRGLYARLERAWVTAGGSGNDNKLQDRLEIQSIIDQLPTPDNHSDDQEHINAWKQALRVTFGGTPPSNTEPQKKKSIFSKVKFKRKEYSSNISCMAEADKPTPSDLLSRAWLVCHEAQVWYADAKLRDYYLDDCEKLLQINRISGERLSMAHCYINLAIVEKDAEDSENTRSQSTLAAVLKVDDALEEQTVTLDKLLEPRKCHDGSVRAPRRLLIRGRAGVGKTTFCKKIMHEFTRQPVDDSFRTWTERYDRILWLPLRNLKRHRAHLGYSLAELLKEEFFPRCLESTIFSKALDNYSSAGYGNSRTLFLLDGLDEVSDLLDSDHKMAGFLRWLLQQPNAIITSRPGGNHTNSLVDLDCEMETVGFHTREVWAYIGQTVKQVDAKIAMRKFLDNHPLLLSLMRIPVQLDAFCYIWDGPSAEADKENLSTITSIYQSIERRLWYKDIPRLRDVTVESALELTSSEADELVQGEKVFLQALAFAGLYHDVVDFQLQECDDVRVSLSLGESKLKGPLSDTLGSLSFLRTSDVSAPHGNSTRRRIYLQRTYHFIHLTYQEYFAAQYFVSCWTDGTRLDLSKFGNRKHVNRDPIDFLQQNKYQSRFNIFWRFVAGILRDHDRSHNHAGGKKHLAGFFGALEKQPRDILGPTHLRLVMHCLSESDPMHNRPWFDKHREMLRQWMIWECYTHRYSSLAEEAEFPALLYDTVLQQMPDDIKRNMMKSRSGDPAARLQFMANEVAKNTNLSNQAIRLLKSYPHLPLNILHTLLPPLKDIFKLDIHTGSSDIGEIGARRSILVGAIGANLSDAMEHVFCFLSDNDENAVKRFAEYFSSWFEQRQKYVAPSYRWHAISSEDNERLSHYLQHPVKMARFAAMHALLSQEPLPIPALEALLVRLQNSAEHVIEETVQWLRSAKPLPNELRPAITQCLYNPNEDVRTCAAELLSTTSTGILSDSDSDTMVSVLAGASQETKKHVIDAIGNVETTLTPGVIGLLHTWLKGRFDIRESAINAFSRQRAPEDVLKTLGTLLRDDPDAHVRVQAARALGYKKASLPREVVHDLLMALHNPDESVARASLQTLCRLDVSDDALVEAVMRLLNKTYEVNIPRDLFYNRWKLPHALDDKLFNKFRECAPEEKCRYGIANYLCDQASLLQETTVRAIFEEHQRILARLDIDANVKKRKLYEQSHEDKVLFEMSRILSRRTALPTDVQKCLLDQLNNGSAFASLVAAKALSHPQLLAPEVISGLAELIKTEDIDVRFQALRILAGKANLPADVLHMFATMLERSIRDRRALHLISESLHLISESLYILSDEDYSRILGCDEWTFSEIMASWLARDPRDVTLYPDPDGDTHYIVNLPQSQKRILKADLPMPVEQYLKNEGVPEALNRE